MDHDTESASFMHAEKVLQGIYFPETLACALMIRMPRYRIVVPPDGMMNPLTLTPQSEVLHSIGTEHWRGRKALMEEYIEFDSLLVPFLTSLGRKPLW